MAMGGTVILKKSAILQLSESDRELLKDGYVAKPISSAFVTDKQELWVKTEIVFKSGGKTLIKWFWESELEW